MLIINKICIKVAGYLVYLFIFYYAYTKAAQNQMVDALRYKVLLRHSLQKKCPSWGANHPFLLLVLVIIMYCSIPRIMSLQIVRVLCNMFCSINNQLLLIISYFSICTLKRTKELKKHTSFWKYRRNTKNLQDYLPVSMLV